MPSIPTIEELGVADWVPPERQTEIPKGSRFDRLLERDEEKKKEEYTLLNGILFFTFIVPSLAAKLIGGRMSTFHSFVFVWIHEAGHGFWGLVASIIGLPRWFGAVAGTGNELLFSIVPALLFFRGKESYAAGCVLMMCAGMSIQYAGWYMQSAQHPRGIGVGGLPVTSSTHDWTIVLGYFGFLGDAFSIGMTFAAAGHAIAVIFLIASTMGFLPSLYGWTPKKLSNITAPAASIALFYFLYIGTRQIELVIALLLSIPLASRLTEKRKEINTKQTLN